MFGCVVNGRHWLNLPVLGALALLSLLVVVAFWPGVTGIFIHDDTRTLELLGRQEGIRDFDSLRFFIFNGISSSLSRPISLLSFTLNAQDWPALPRSFFITNIFIHVLNGLVLFFVVYKLFRLLNEDEGKSKLIAFSATAIWLLHPLQVSTVLYIVQRMTELATLFGLIGIWCYLHGRSKLWISPGAGYWWMTGGLLLFGSLSLLSKENGALLPALILVLELTLLNKVARPDHWRYWASVMLFLPTLMIVILLIYMGLNHVEAYALRDFSLYERLLTQSRVLISYILAFLLPLDTPSVFHDDFEISTSLVDPITTLLSIATILLLLLTAVFIRKKQPIISFVILWFFTAHLVESTVISLELYYDHRNYFPFVGIAIALGYYLVALPIKLRAKRSLIALLCLLLSGLTWHYSSVWGDQLRFAELLTREHPQSFRARMHYAARLFFNGNRQEAITYLDRINEQYPEYVGGEILQAAFSCTLNQYTKDEYVQLVQNAGLKDYDTVIALALKRLYEFIKAGHCKQLTVDAAVILIDTVLNNPNMHNRIGAMAYLYTLKGNILYEQRNLDTLIAYGKAFELAPSFETAIRLAQLYASIGKTQEAYYYATTARIFDVNRNPLLPSQEPRITEALAGLQQVQ